MQLLAGRYKMREALGEGSSAVVHYGFDSTLKRPVAIKMFHPYVSDAGDGPADVLREARTSAGLNHPNIAQVYDYGEVIDGTERTPFLVMEFLDGETLADRLARTGALRWRQAASIAADTAAALAHAHSQELVHRDVNPRNIMLTPDGVKVLDFGIAIAAGGNSIDTNGGIWGSVAHLAPEQLRGEPTYPAADVYALGLLLFECLTGARAWPGTLGEILANRHERPAPRLPRISGLPKDIIRLYEACTAEDPQERPTAESVAETLRSLSGPAPLTRTEHQLPMLRGAADWAPLGVTATPAKPARRPIGRRRAALVGALAAVATVLSILGLQLANGGKTPGGKPAEAAVESPHPAATSPRPSSPAATTPATSAPVYQQVEKTETPARNKTKKPRKSPSAKPSKKPTTPSATPSSTPSSSPKPTDPPPSQTPDPTDPATDPTEQPTDPETTPPTEDTTPPTTPTTTKSTGDQTGQAESSTENSLVA
ncbi:protein kinase [Actinoplanes sp. NPDC049596]|uniref:serine/threonine protein kinase n=1 Tax=unclassified Actinoplanes TaxID=2626549 RepID=UPI0034314E8D